MATQGTQQPFPIGYRREGFPEVMGWSEVVAHSDRKDSGVRAMRAAYPKTFPTPVAVVQTTPIYLADEVREFFAAHPRQRARIDNEMIEQIRGLAAGGASQRTIATVLEISLTAVNKYI